MASYKTPPEFGERKPYSRWVDEVRAWEALTDLEVKKRGLALALSLPEEHSNNIRDKVFSEVPIEDLNKEDGVKTLLRFMDNIFKKDELSEAYEVYADFDRYKRTEEISIEMYVMEFEKLYHRTKKFKMELPEAVLAFKLLEGANLNKTDKQLVLTGVDYAKPDTLFRQMTCSLKKFFGKQSMVSCEANQHKGNIKVEPVFMADEEEEAYYVRPQGNYRYSRGHGSGRFMNNGRIKGRFTFGARGEFRGGHKRTDRDSEYLGTKKLNPIGSDGNPLRCRSCESIRHLIKDCPHSYENMERNSIEKAVLFTGNKLGEMEVLVSESINSAVLDSACTSTVAGEGWIRCYLDTLDKETASQVVRSESSAVFKFGSGKRFPSKGKLTLPCKIAGVECQLTTDIVDCEIPLLLSKAAMKKAKMKLDMENDRASVFGKDVDLHSTSSGHYCLTLEQPPISVEDTRDVLISAKEESTDKKIIIEKLHKQFAHPTGRRLKALLRDAGVQDNSYEKYVDEISDSCQICKKYKKTPPRPCVSLPLATEFNEVVALDLKEWKQGIYFIHMIDLATRFSLAGVIHRKTPAVIIDKVMKLWIGGGMGTPEVFLSDNGGEFANEEFRDMAENLNVKVWNTAGLSPWQNGLCERNHAIVDDCVAKILEDNPRVDLEIALVWAVNAKNSLQMVYGYSPYQLVFGINPRLPSVLIDKPPALQGTTMSKVFAEHLNSLNSARRAFIQAESSDRIRRALRHQIRASGEIFEQGELVYYKRDDSHKWKGPGKVIGQDGKVVFVRHGSVYVRVHPCRLLKVGEEFLKTPDKEYIVAGDERKVEINDRQYDEDLDNEGSLKEEMKENHSERVEDNMSIGVQMQTEKSDKSLPKVHDIVEYLPVGSDEWRKAKIVSRGGKATGKNWAYLNILDDGENETKGINFETDIEKWKVVNDPGSENNVAFLSKACPEEEKVRVAKELELKNWKSFGVYEEVEDIGQQSLSSRWVITEKYKDGNLTCKARLVARGFEDEDNVQTDSPMAGKETIKIFLALVSSMSWECKTIDIKAAFLQGKPIEREVYLRPPIEAGSEGVWKLKKCVYGLCDASRNWYFSVRDELLLNGCYQSSKDLALFYWYNEKSLAGLFIMHVDDFLWAGTSAFKELVIDRICTKFRVGNQMEGNFRYIGVEISQTEDVILLNQHSYVNEMVNVPLHYNRANDKDGMLNKKETKQLREVIGQSNWVVNQSRPDVCFDSLELSMSTKHPRVENLLQANKLIRRIKADTYSLAFPKLGNLADIEIILFSDASYANLSDGVSSAGGHIIFLKGENGKCCPISWSTKKIRRVVKSTIAAEALSLVDGLDTAFYVGSIITEILYRGANCNKIPINCYIDNRSLYENLHSTKSVNEKRLRIDIAAVKEMMQKGEISKVKWIEASNQLSDCLTKKGASSKKLINVLKTGQMSTLN